MSRVKRHVNELPDFDERGRQRRFHAPEAPEKMTVRFVDGPLKGMTKEVNANAEAITVAGFRYSYCGREKRITLFARVPKARALRRVLWRAIGASGKDPRLAAAKWREGRKPKRGQA